MSDVYFKDKCMISWEANLWDDGEPGPEGAQAELGDVQPVNGQGPGGCLVYPGGLT